MSRNASARTGFAALAVSLAALAVSPALAAGGGGGGGGGGGTAPCVPLTMKVAVGHADGNGNSSIGDAATIRNCTGTPIPLKLTVSVPGSGTVPGTFSTGTGWFPTNFALTVQAGPIGSTPLLLHFGQTYTVVGTLSETGATPATLATVTTTVTMPPGVIS
jgi:hypothetical protein